MSGLYYPKYLGFEAQSRPAFILRWYVMCSGLVAARLVVGVSGRLRFTLVRANNMRGHFYSSR